MCFGGIEKALLNLLKNIDYKKYSVTLLLEEKEGPLLKEIPSNVIIKEYRINNNKNVLFRKIVNRLKLIFFILLNLKKYDFSACFYTSSTPMSIISRYLSKNNYIWVHSNYKYVYNQNETQFRNFFKQIKINKFNRIIFVSNESKNDFIYYYPSLAKKCSVCNNLVDYKEIIELSKEPMPGGKENIKVLLHVGRHTEEDKRISRLINIAKKLVDNNYHFKMWLIGDGLNHQNYLEQIEELNLNDYIDMLGSKTNPYPYYRHADVFVLTSEFEGFPVVYLESLVMNLPIITTIPVSSDDLNIEEYATIVSKQEDDIYKAVANFLDDGTVAKKEFDPVKYNNDISAKLEKMFNGQEL